MEGNIDSNTGKKSALLDLADSLPTRMVDANPKAKI